MPTCPCHILTYVYMYAFAGIVGWETKLSFEIIIWPDKS